MRFQTLAAGAVLPDVQQKNLDKLDTLCLYFTIAGSRACLLMDFDVDDGRRQQDAAEEGAGVFVIAGRDAAPLFQS